MNTFPSWQAEKWQDSPMNPVIGYFETPEAGYAIGDPQILVPGQFDSQWHAFYHGFYKDFTPFYHHLISPDGVRWALRRKWQWPTSVSFLFHDGDEWILYFTAVTTKEERDKYNCGNIISMRRTRDFENWSEPETVLVPELDWEREHMPLFYPAIQARNPCMVKLSKGQYRLYYSAGTVMLDKCGYEEPKHISFADAPTPYGPFTKHGKPILSPDASIPHRNLGAGAIKVFGLGDKFLALYNSIYNDENGWQHSAINVLMSDDGISWEEAPYNPILSPSPAGKGWKAAFVYQLDLVRWEEELRIYYNGRNTWRDGIECIGLSVLKGDPTPVRKLWDLQNDAVCPGGKGGDL